MKASISVSFNKKFKKKKLKQKI